MLPTATRIFVVSSLFICDLLRHHPLCTWSDDIGSLHDSYFSIFGHCNWWFTAVIYICSCLRSLPFWGINRDGMGCMLCRKSLYLLICMIGTARCDNVCWMTFENANGIYPFEYDCDWLFLWFWFVCVYILTEFKWILASYLCCCKVFSSKTYRKHSSFSSSMKRMRCCQVVCWIN